jgi:hypothetical protein
MAQEKDGQAQTPQATEKDAVATAPEDFVSILV